MTATAHKTYLFGISLVAALGGFLFGYDTAVISGTIGFVKGEFTLTTMLEGWFVSSALVGCLVGVSVAGILSDRFGRKKVLLLSAVLFFISALGCMLAGKMTPLILYRILGGIGVGIASMLSPLYISELSPPGVRGRLVALYQLAITLGILLAYFSNAWLEASSTGGMVPWANTSTWRVMFGSETLPALLFFLLLLFIPESPRWLTRMKRPEKALAVLTKINGAAVANEVLQDIKTVLAQKTGSLREIFQPGMRMALIVGIAIAVLSQFSGINAVIYYGVQILDEAGFSLGDALGSQVLIGLVNFAFTFLAIWKIDKMGRKPLLMWGVSGIVLAHLVIGFLFFQNLSSGYALMFFLLFFIACFAATLGPISWVVISEIFPTHIRGRVLSIATLCLWGANALLMQLVPWLLEALGPAGTFWLFALLSFPMLILVWKKLPETKGKSLEEIEKSW
jgi:SP family arabinose:H+ symporter-like MFS transporter